MLTEFELLLRLLLAAGLGCLIGIDRERQNWTAGLRTHMLVAVGAALLMLISIYGFTSVQNTPGISVDPTRIASQVVSGIGFLGAGSILVGRSTIYGLTTAASIWAVAALGLAAGAGMYLAAALAAGLMLLILAGLKPIERLFFRSQLALVVTLNVDPGQFKLSALQELLQQAGLKTEQLELRSAPTPGEQELRVQLQRGEAQRMYPLGERLQNLPGVRRVVLITE